MIPEYVGIPEKFRRVLVIEDSERERDCLRACFAGEGIELTEASDGPSGLDCSRIAPPDLILLGLGAPGPEGFEVLRSLKADARTGGVPVIVFSAASDASEKARGLDLGAADHVTRPFDPAELRARVRVALRAKSLHDSWERRAHLDDLTGLASRAVLEERLRVEHATRRRLGGPLSVWVVGLDGLPRINADHGRGAGDAALRRAAALLRRSARATDLVARHGGGFAVVSPRCPTPSAIERAEAFRAALAAEVMTIILRPIRITASVGVATIDGDDLAPAALLLADADQALHGARLSGGDVVNVWRRSGPCALR